MIFLRLIKSESYKRGTVLSVLFNIVSKGILFLLTIIIARYFGSNIKTDIYFFCLCGHDPVFKFYQQYWFSSAYTWVYAAAAKRRRWESSSILKLFFTDLFYHWHIVYSCHVFFWNNGFRTYLKIFASWYCYLSQLLLDRFLLFYFSCTYQLSKYYPYFFKIF